MRDERFGLKVAVLLMQNFDLILSDSISNDAIIHNSDFMDALAWLPDSHYVGVSAVKVVPTTTDYFTDGWGRGNGLASYSYFDHAITMREDYLLPALLFHEVGHHICWREYPGVQTRFYQQKDAISGSLIADALQTVRPEIQRVGFRNSEHHTHNAWDFWAETYSTYARYLRGDAGWKVYISLLQDYAPSLLETLQGIFDRNDFTGIRMLFAGDGDIDA